jgi:hypothetical protein
LKFKAALGIKDISKSLKSFTDKKPSVIEAFLTFSAIEVMTYNAREKLWDHMSQNFPGPKKDLKNIKERLLNVAEKLALDPKVETGHHSTIWTPKNKGVNHGRI